jgi:hypothetical protein
MAIIAEAWQKLKGYKFDIIRGFFAFFSGFTTIAITYFYFAVEYAEWPLTYLEFAMCICWFSLIWIYVATERRLQAALAFALTVIAAATLLLSFASIYRIEGIIDSSTKELVHNPVDCLYFSVVTFTTVGYGDFIPPPGLRLVAAAEAFAGYLSLALIIAVFSHFWGTVVKNSN